MSKRTDLVLQYLEEVYKDGGDLSPLHFSFKVSSASQRWLDDPYEVYELYHDKLSDAKFKSTTNLDDLVVMTVEATMLFDSLDSNNTIETLACRRRSTIDICRHIKFYRPETTIFEVMDSVYRQFYKHFYILLCPDIKRVAIRSKDLADFIDAHLIENDISDTRITEYDITFGEWKDIQKDES